VTDGAVAFTWGTGQRWIAFEELRQRAGVWRAEGAGLIAFDPHDRSTSFVEHLDSGTALRGTLAIVDSRTIERHYRSYEPDGTIRARVDTWRWDDPAARCFEWTTRDAAPGSERASDPVWLCREA
jgi:hypothetical protein